jgi:hypothetical protein
MVNVVGEEMLVEGLGVKAEKKPPARGTHGCWKLDWTTEWFFIIASC